MRICCNHNVCEEYVEAIERVAEAYPDATLVVCGDGPLREELEEQAGAE